MREAIFGFIGVLVGGAIGIVGTLLQLFNDTKNKIIERKLLNFHHSKGTDLSRYYRGNLGGDYETSCQPRNTRKKTASSRTAFETRPYLPLRSPRSGSFSKLRGALAASLPEEGSDGLKAQAAYGAAPASLRGAEESLGAHLGERVLGSRLLDGSLDLETYRSNRPQELSGALLDWQSLESDERLGLELPEAAEEGQRTPGRSDSLLEASSLAVYKKRPRGLEPAWSSWMRADFRSSPTSKEPGRSKEKRQRSLSLDAGPKSRPSPPSRSRPRENALDSTHAFTPTKTFGRDKLDNSFGTFGVTSKARLSSSGTEALSTGPSSSSNSLEAVLESRPFTSRDMRLNLTPMNLSGQTSSEAWQTAFPETLSIFDNSLTGRLEDFGIPRDSYGRAFTHRIYRGHDLYPLLNESSVVTLMPYRF